MYCIPETLQNASVLRRYQGPELEMWSLGITLYTLVFGENPFYDIEETIHGILKPPFIITSGKSLFVILGIGTSDTVCIYWMNLTSCKKASNSFSFMGSFLIPQGTEVSV